MGLAAFGQAVFVGRFDTDKHRVESGPGHESEQSRVVGQIDAHFCAEWHADSAFSPLDQRRQLLRLELLLVADKVVVHEKDALSPAQRVEAVQLGDDLCSSLGARAMPQQRRHVAKVATEGTASGELNADRFVMPEIRQSPKGHRGLADVRELGRGVDVLSTAGGKVCQERRQGQFGLVEDKVVHAGELLMLHGEEQPARHHLHPDLLAAGDEGSRRTALRDHGADKDIVGPCQVFWGHAGHVEVNQPLFPLGGQHGRYSQQAERRCTGLFADKFERVLEAPERIRRLGLDQ